MSGKVSGAMGGRFEYREPWIWVAAFAVLGTISAGWGLYRIVAGDQFAPRLAATMSIWGLLLLGLVQWGLAVGLAVVRMRGKRTIEVSDTAVKLPRNPWSPFSVPVPFEQISALCVSRRQYGRRLLLAWPDGRFVVTSTVLASATEFDRLIEVLVARLEPLGIEIDVRREADGSKRFRPQFTLGRMLLVVTIVAVGLGMHAHVYGNLSWDAATEIGCALVIVLVVPWIVLVAPWSVRAFAIGFLLGYWMELGAVMYWAGFDWTQGAAGSAGTGTWYPLTFALHGMAENRPSLAWLGVAARAHLVAGVCSGLFGAVLATAAYVGIQFARTRAARRK